ncbi:MAG: Fic family protein, partial [Pirellulales bacterium]
MDVKRFSRRSPGDLVLTVGGEKAFVPNALPPNWTFPGELWPLLAEAKQQVGILEGVGRLLPNPGLLLRPLEDREAIQSSRLEGTFASPRELLLFEIDQPESTSEDDPANSWREVYNYRRALHLATNSELPLSLRLIREVHAELLFAVRGRDRSPGNFRRVQVYIGSSHRFIPPPPQHLPELLDNFEKYLNVTSSGYDPLVDAFLAHYQFECIHPFLDGNGRVGRLLLAITFQRRCGLSKPWLYLSEYFEAHRDEYVEHLFNVSAKADWNSWVSFCLRGVLQQARDAIQRCDLLRDIKNRYAKLLDATGGTIRLNQIVDSLFYSPYVQVTNLAKQLSVSYPTAKADLDRLVQSGILAELPNASPKTF